MCSVQTLWSFQACSNTSGIVSAKDSRAGLGLHRRWKGRAEQVGHSLASLFQLSMECNLSASDSSELKSPKAELLGDAGQGKEAQKRFRCK